MMSLKFSSANTKLLKIPKYIKKSGKSYSLDLLAGKSCPGAKQCKCSVVQQNNKYYSIKDGKDCKFRCFSASLEALYSKVYQRHLSNYLAIKNAKTKKKISKLIQENIPKNATVIRYHSSGDFFTQSYFDAAIEVAINNPEIIFYAYTKSLLFWTKRLNDIPNNLILTASYGGKYDNLIEKYNLRSATVVFSKNEAKKLNLKIDKNDSKAAQNGISFALLLHGIQPAKTKASKAWQIIKNSK